MVPAGVRPIRVVDLSKEIVYSKRDPLFMRVRVKHHAHGRARWLVRALGLPFRLFPTLFAGWADDTITRLGVHATTHIDAPWHYGPMDAEGRRMATIDEMPLELGFGPGVVFDMRHKAEGEAISRADMEAELERTGAALGPGVIALIRTGRDQYLGTPEYWKRGTGMSAEATEFLLERGVRVCGIDQWGWDRPFHTQIAESKRTGNRELFWEGHLVGRQRPFWHMEQLRGLDELPSHGFYVSVLPLRIKGASASPARVVAFLYE